MESPRLPSTRSSNGANSRCPVPGYPALSDGSLRRHRWPYDFRVRPTGRATAAHILAVRSCAPATHTPHPVARGGLRRHARPRHRRRRWRGREPLLGLGVLEPLREDVGLQDGRGGPLRAEEGEGVPVLHLPDCVSGKPRSAKAATRRFSGARAFPSSGGGPRDHAPSTRSLKKPFDIALSPRTSGQGPPRPRSSPTSGPCPCACPLLPDRGGRRFGRRGPRRRPRSCRTGSSS